MSRRGLLAGGFSLVLLTACGSKSSGTADSGAAPTDSGDTSQSALMAFFDPNSELSVGSPQRAVVGIGDITGALLENIPEKLTFTLKGGGNSQQITAVRRNEGLPHGYYVVGFTPSASGTYDLSTTFRGHQVTTQFTVGDKSALPAVGSAMPKLQTPTTADARGVDPICTRDPQCPLHSVSLDTALTLGKPVAFLISTPKFCQVAICGPVLDVLLSVQAEFADRVTFIHQEVYANGAEAAEKGASAKLAPALEALALPFEPMLILVGADGTIARRLDHIFDRSELRAALTEVTA